MESAYGHTVRRDILLFGYSRNDSETGSRKSRGRRDWKNPVLITVPCHRVIGKNGKLTGFRGGLEMKKQLLALEGGNIETLEYRLSRTGGNT